MKFVSAAGKAYRSTKQEDSEGIPLVGEDEYGLWWGTEDAFWLVQDVEEEGYVKYPSKKKWQFFHVLGYVGAEEYNGFFCASSQERVENYVKDRRVDVGFITKL